MSDAGRSRRPGLARGRCPASSRLLSLLCFRELKHTDKCAVSQSRGLGAPPGLRSRCWQGWFFLGKPGEDLFLTLPRVPRHLGSWTRPPSSKSAAAGCVLLAPQHRAPASPSASGFLFSGPVATLAHRGHPGSPRRAAGQRPDVTCRPRCRRCAASGAHRFGALGCPHLRGLLLCLPHLLLFGNIAVTGPFKLRFTWCTGHLFCFFPKSTPLTSSSVDFGSLTPGFASKQLF